MHLLAFIIALLAAPALATPHPEAPGPHLIYGVIRAVGPTSITLQRHNGSFVVVDITYAREVGRTGVLYVRRPVGVYGQFEGSARYRANAVTSANGIEHGLWPADH